MATRAPGGLLPNGAVDERGGGRPLPPPREAPRSLPDDIQPHGGQAAHDSARTLAAQPLAAQPQETGARCAAPTLGTIAPRQPTAGATEETDPAILMWCGQWVVGGNGTWKGRKFAIRPHPENPHELIYDDPAADGPYLHSKIMISSDDCTAGRHIVGLQGPWTRKEYKLRLVDNSAFGYDHEIEILVWNQYRRVDPWKKEDPGPPIKHDPSSVKAIFTKIYKEDLWTIGKSKSGGGSDMGSPLVKHAIDPDGILDQVVTKYGFKSMVDAGCGDFSWMVEWVNRHPDITYIGVDIVEHLIVSHNEKYADDPRVTFASADLCSAPPPLSDFIFCKEVLNHLDLSKAAQVVENFKQASKYLVALSDESVSKNEQDFKTGYRFRDVNL